MKKLIFVLLMAVAMVGFVSAAETVHPPGDITLTAEIACISAVFGCPVILATAPTGYESVILLPVENITLYGNERFPVNIWELVAAETISIETFVNTDQRMDYYLRL